MIKELTKKQEATVIPFREEWRKIGLSTERVDKETTKKTISGLYRRLDKRPSLFIFCPSPLWCIQQANFFKFLLVDKGSNLGSNLESNLQSNLRRNLESNLWRNLESNLRRNLESNIWSNLRSNLGRNLWSNLQSNLRSNQDTKNKILKELHEYHEFYGYGQMDSAWIAFYQFMETIGIKYDDKDSELLEFWAQTAKSCSWFWTFENFVFVSDRPTRLCFDTDYRLHSDQFPAYEYSDGWKGYYLHGVHFPEELWKKVVSRKMSFQDILAIQDIDQRTQAMKYGDVREFLKHQNAKQLDTYEKQTLDGVKICYELWEIPKGDVFTKNVHYCLYSCPSTAKLYMSGVPEFKSVPEAMAWRQDISVADWERMIPLFTES